MVVVSNSKTASKFSSAYKNNTNHELHDSHNQQGFLLLGRILVCLDWTAVSNLSDITCLHTLWGTLWTLSNFSFYCIKNIISWSRSQWKIFQANVYHSHLSVKSKFQQRTNESAEDNKKYYMVNREKNYRMTKILQYCEKCLYCFMLSDSTTSSLSHPWPPQS